MDYVLGVDGGSTKTIALVATFDGRIVGAGRSGGSNIYGHYASEAEPIQAIADAVDGALTHAGVDAPSVAVGAFSLCGADWPEDFDFFRAEIERRGFGRRVIMANDAMGALRAGTSDGVGVVVVCGTAAATGARARDGRIWHSSFWQGPGGAVELGHKALDAACRAELGIDPPTRLTDRILRALHQPSMEAALHWLTARGSEKKDREVASLAAVLLDEARLGDAAAERIVREHGAALGDYAVAAARRVDLTHETYALVLAGGVFRNADNSKLLADSLAARVLESSPGARPVRSRFDPAVGALFLAWEAAGLPVDESRLSRMIPTLPPASLFETLS